MRVAVTIVLAAAARVATAAPAPEIKVAVIPSVTVNIDVVRVDALCQDLAEALETELEVEAIGGLEVRRLVPRGIAADCVASGPCVRDLATRLGVDQVLFVAMVDAGMSGAIRNSPSASLVVPYVRATRKPASTNAAQMTVVISSPCLDQIVRITSRTRA